MTTNTIYRLKPWIEASGSKYLSLQKRFLFFFWLTLNSTCSGVDEEKDYIKHMENRPKL